LLTELIAMPSLSTILTWLLVLMVLLFPLGLRTERRLKASIVKSFVKNRPSYWDEIDALKNILEIFVYLHQSIASSRVWRMDPTEFDTSPLQRAYHAKLAVLRSRTEATMAVFEERVGLLDSFTQLDMKRGAETGVIRFWWSFVISYLLLRILRASAKKCDATFSLPTDIFDELQEACRAVGPWGFGDVGLAPEASIAVQGERWRRRGGQEMMRAWSDSLGGENCS
jgi:hypothetical protein